MGIRVAVVVGYFLVLLVIGWAARRRSQPGLTDYFVASRSTRSIVLFLTMAATNFSAFTVFGFAGAGWESGYAFYPVMAFGTGFMALAFALIGEPIQRLGKIHGLITPSELLYHITGSPTLRLLFFVVMTVFTLPYLAMQPMAAGYALQSLLGIPYFAGAALITAIMLMYTFLGGFRGVSWTDTFQGGMMMTLLLVAVIMIAKPFGGLSAANHAVAVDYPALFARPGMGGLYSPGVWFGYMALWLLCDPMFPQLFQRFYAARDSRALTTTMTLYPLLTGFLFLLPVTIGVLGRLSYPQLPVGASADQILPLMLAQHVPPVIEALVLTAALAALMSTLDSQLLTLSSMFTRDVVGPIQRQLARRAGRDVSLSTSDEVPAWVGKSFVVVLALVGLGIAIHPPASFRILATQTFTGLAVLFPTVVAALYWKRMTAAAAISSILVGEGLVVAYYYKLLPTFGTLSVIPIVLASSIVLVLVSLISRRRPMSAAPAQRSRRFSLRFKIGWTATFSLLFLLGHDFWNWGDARASWLGYPWWVWMFAGLCVLTSVAFGTYSHASHRHEARTSKP
ncbi:sodium:solute symporter family protein [Candidatus Bipolaricaulota bacterium]|nr:sodium:solute symporter family protein [Candidatus Bipolaricaulota bacterium]